MNRSSKPKCLALLDRVWAEGITVVICKRGKIVAKLVAETDSRDKKPWLDLRGQSHFTGDPFAPAVGEDDIDALPAGSADSGSKLTKRWLP